MWISWGVGVDNFLEIDLSSINNRRMNKKLFFVVLVLVLVVVGGLSYYFWPRAVDPGMQLIENYEQAMREDTYGGKTPEETLKLFVEALKKEDVELASKYFLLDDNGSREKWEKRLTELKEKKLLLTMAGDIELGAKPDLQNKITENDFKYSIYKTDGTIGADIDMELNKYSGVWKIEQL